MLQKKKDAHSLYLLGILYLFGIYFNQNIPLGLSSLKIAAEKNHSYSIMVFIEIYNPNRTRGLAFLDYKLDELEIRKHVQTNTSLYRSYLIQYGKLGYPDGYLRLANNIIHDSRIDVNERITTAMDWINKADELNKYDSQSQQLKLNIFVYIKSLENLQQNQATQEHLTDHQATEYTFAHRNDHHNNQTKDKCHIC